MIARPRRLLLPLLLCLGAAVTAQPIAPASPEPRRVVQVVASSSVDLEALVAELLRPLPVTLRWSQVASIDAREVLAHRTADPLIVARVWLDLADAQRAYLYVANASERFIVRAVPIENGYDEVARESLAHILESVVDALLSGADIGVSREIAEKQLADRLPAAPAPSPVTSSPTVSSLAPKRVRVTLAAFYRAGAWSGDDLVHAPGLGVGLAFPRAERSLAATLWLWASAIVPFTWEGDRAGAAFRGVSLRLVAGIEGRVGRRVRLRALIGPGLDAVEVRSRPNVPILAVRPFWVLAPMATLLGMIDVHLGGPIAIFFAAGAEADLVGTHYDILLADRTHETALRPWPVRPLGVIGFSGSW